MKQYFLIILMLLSSKLFGQTKFAQSWIVNEFKVQKLDEHYKLQAFLKPAFLEDDFNGDGRNDIAALVIQKKTNKKGILLIHGGSAKYYFLGAGSNFGNGGDNFEWLKGWRIYKKKVVYKTTFSTDGDITGAKKIKLIRHGIQAMSLIDGQLTAAAIIYWDGSKYIWIHEGE